MNSEDQKLQKKYDTIRALALAAGVRADAIGYAETMADQFDDAGAFLSDTRTRFPQFFGGEVKPTISLAEAERMNLRQYEAARAAGQIR